MSKFFNNPVTEIDVSADFSNDEAYKKYFRIKHAF